MNVIPKKQNTNNLLPMMIDASTASPSIGDKSFEPSWDFSDSLHSSIETPVKTDHNIAHIFHMPLKPNNSDETIQSKLADHQSENHIFISKYVHNDLQYRFNQYISRTIQVNGPAGEKKHKPKKNTKDLCLNLLTFSDIACAFDQPGQQTKSIENIAILSCLGWDKGIHELSFKILKCDIYRQEIGVISVNYIETLKMTANGIRNTDSFGARAVYGHYNKLNASYYASYNKDGTARCYKDLTKSDNIAWSEGDIVKICLNVDKCRIKFFINDIKIRKTLSLEKSQTYYPIISFSGECEYQLIDFK